MISPTVSGTRPRALSRMVLPVSAAGAPARALADMPGPRGSRSAGQIAQAASGAHAPVQTAERLDQKDQPRFTEAILDLVGDVIGDRLRIESIAFGEQQHRLFLAGKPGTLEDPARQHLLAAFGAHGSAGRVWVCRTELMLILMQPRQSQATHLQQGGRHVRLGPQVLPQTRKTGRRRAGRSEILIKVNTGCRHFGAYGCSAPGILPAPHAGPGASGGHPAGTQESGVKLAYHAQVRGRGVAVLLRGRDPPENIPDDVEARLLLVIGAHHHPGRVGVVRPQQHAVAGAAVVAPVFLRRLVDRADLPLLQGILAALTQAARLFLAGDVEVVLQQDGSGAHQQSLETRSRLQEILMLRGRAALHDRLHAGAVVPAAVEQHDLLRRRQIAHEALEVPFGFLAVARFSGGDDACLTWTQVLHDSLDRAVLAGAVAAFKDHEYLQVVGDDVAVQPYEFDLQTPQLVGVLALANLRNVLVGVLALL